VPRHKDGESGEEQRKTYWIDWKPAAIDAASVLHREDKLGAQLVLTAVYELSENPKPGNSANLGRGGLRRLLLGYYRVLYKVSEKNATVTVIMVAKAPHPQ
jgi:mRNA interferase RelE/StbE